MKIINALLATLVVAFITGCNSNQPKPTTCPETQGQHRSIKIANSKYLERIEDQRQEEEKISHKFSNGGIVYFHIGDNAFSHSPLNEIASSLGVWFDRNKTKNIKISSLTVYLGEKVEGKAVKQYALPKHFLHSDPFLTPLDNLMIDIIWARYDRDLLPKGSTVVVRLEAVVNEKKMVIEHSQSPVYRSCPHDLVSAALNYTGYKLSQKLLK